MKIKDEKAGKDGTCPKCQATFTVPGAAKETVRQSGSKSDEKQSSRVDDDIPDDDLSGYDDDEDDSPPSLRSGSDDDLASSGKKKSASYRSFEEDDFVPPPPKPAKAATPPRPPAMSAAQLAGDLMQAAAGDESTKKKSRKQFGAEDEQKKNKQSTVFDLMRYNANKIIPLVVGTIVLALGAFWLSSKMMRGSDLPPLGSVTGTVTLDGQPLKDAIIMFIPEIPDKAKKEQTRLATSLARTDASGKYVLNYVQDVDGAVVGKHIVQIRAQKEGREVIPVQFNKQSKLTATVASGSNDFKFDLKSAP